MVEATVFKTQEEAAHEQLASIFDSREFREHGEFQTILAILEEFPILASRQYKTVYPCATVTPLCCLLTSSKFCNVEVIRRVYELYRCAVTDPQGNNQDTALHFACRHNATTDVVEFIYSKNPYAIATLNGSGRPPLESLLPGLKTTLGSHSRIQTLSALLRACPKAIEIRNFRGQNLLETALTLGGWSTTQALSYIAASYIDPEIASPERLVEVMTKVENARRLRPKARQSIQFALLTSFPSLWAH